jgi:alkyldihydroxyacetonephosphate synthase
MPAERMRWWGWGEERRAPALSPGALSVIRETLAIAGQPRPPVALERVRLDPSALAPKAAAALREILGADGLRDDHADRVAHAAGRGYPDLVRLRAGTPESAPDAVAYPSTREQLAATLDACARHSLAVVPFGAGTSVVGGVAPLRGAHAAVIALDMGRLARVIDIDRESAIVTVQAGLRARELERALAREGLTLGHFPQSFEYVTLGGCAATRSAGQASTGYGRFEQLVVGVSLSAPAGRIELAAHPASAAGPDLRQLIVGSEGTLGAIDELSLRVRTAPAVTVYEGAFFQSFEQGARALREMAQSRCAPDVARLSDENETSLSLKLAGSEGMRARVGRAYVGARGYGQGCLAILGLEGAQRDVSARRARARGIVRAHGGLPVGGSPGRAWLRSRFHAPYLRDELITHGVFVETLETATRWGNLHGLHRAVAEAIEGALRACGTPGVVGCHISHLYETGASLYFTFLAPASRGEEIAQWQAVKQAASAAIAAGGGTITHHHAVGRDHAQWLEQEIGAVGVDALRALKAQLDPAGIMNPGKLLA